MTWNPYLVTRKALALRANLADQNIQQPQKLICVSRTIHDFSVWNKPLIWSTHVNIVQLAEPCNQSLHVCSLANAGFQNRGVCLQTFPFFPSPFPSFQYLALVHWPENPVPRVFLCSEQKHLLHRLHRRLGVDFSFRWSMFDSWPNYFFSFNFVLYFFNHIFYVLACFPFILIAALLITTSRGVSWWPVL